jgi:undecaprenyl-diphosphatase
MSFWQAVLLGIVQGLTEFLPISSTAHLTLVGKLLRCIDPNHPEEWTAFMAVIQLGTIVAVLFYFATDLLDITREFFTGNWDYIQRRTWVLSPNTRIGWYIIIGSVPIVVAGLLLKHYIEGSLTKNLYVIAFSLIFWALAMSLADFYGRLTRSVEQLTIFDAAVVGLAQAFALIPGSSRSGTTITAGLLVGMKRAAAARFSFLLSIPSITGAGVYEFYKSYGHLNSQMYAATITATLVAGIVGYLSIAFLMRFLQNNTTQVFVIYRLSLGTLIFLVTRFTKLGS